MKLSSTAPEITGLGRNKTVQKASCVLQSQAKEQHLSLFYSITAAGTVNHFFPTYLVTLIMAVSQLLEETKLQCGWSEASLKHIIKFSKMHRITSEFQCATFISLLRSC